jgi:hypothetical protein
MQPNPMAKEKRRTMVIGKKIGSLKLLVLAGVMSLTPAVVQAQDSARIWAVTGGNGPISAPISPNKDFTFTAKVGYSQGPLDTAILHVGVEEYQGGANAAAGCRGAVHQTNGGSSVPIGRGSGTVMLKVIWNGAHSVYGNQTQFIGLFVTYSDPITNKVIFSTAPPLPSQCFAVGYGQ